MELIPTELGETTRTLFGGRFGSGKTEVALNYALEWAKALGSVVGGPRPALIDLDIVTPYFRSREVAEQMKARGLDIVAPAAVGQYLDSPCLVPQIMGALQQPDVPVIVDVGGDEQGARALSQYSAVLQECGYALYMVVNPFRPFTTDSIGIRQAIDDIERTSRLLVTGLVSNPNLMWDTTVEVILEGQRKMEIASRQLGIPIVFTAITRGWWPLADEKTLSHSPILPMERFFVMPWEGDETSLGQ